MLDCGAGIDSVVIDSACGSNFIAIVIFVTRDAILADSIGMGKYAPTLEIFCCSAVASSFRTISDSGNCTI